MESQGLEFEWHEFLSRLASVAARRAHSISGWEWATEIEVSIVAHACRKAGMHPSQIPPSFKQVLAFKKVPVQYSKLARIVLLTAGLEEVAKTWADVDA